ncbi:MAG: hypothetical protein ACM4D3_18480 [Candidatus Sericytochromatia bacterium]
MVNDLKFGRKTDEREQTPLLDLGALAGPRYLLGTLTPPVVTVDERGEGLTINLAAVHGDPSATGTSTTDGWGDKPRSWAEAVAAPRIRDGSASRF